MTDRTYEPLTKDNALRLAKVTNMRIIRCGHNQLGQEKIDGVEDPQDS